MPHSAADEYDLLVRLVSHYRYAIHIHSLIYYAYGSSVVTDAQWDEWSNRIIELQTQFPFLKYEGYLPEWFYDWTGDSGYHLPMYEELYEPIRKELRGRKVSGSVSRRSH